MHKGLIANKLEMSRGYCECVEVLTSVVVVVAISENLFISMSFVLSNSDRALKKQYITTKY